MAVGDVTAMKVTSYACISTPLSYNVQPPNYNPKQIRQISNADIVDHQTYEDADSDTTHEA